MSEQPRRQEARKAQGAKGSRQQARAQAAAPALDVTPELINRAKRDIAKMGYVTPAKLAPMLNVKLSVARKILKRLIADGSVDVRAKNRRIIVAVPKSSSSSS